MNIQETRKEIKRLATTCTKLKVQNQKNEKEIKVIFERLRELGVKNETNKYGMVYTVDASTKKSINRTKLAEFLEAHGSKIEDFEEITPVVEHYCIKTIR